MTFQKPIESWAVDRPKPPGDACPTCTLTNPSDDHWKWGKGPKYHYGGTWKCCFYTRFRAYTYNDRCRGFAGQPLTWAEAKLIMVSSCTYCGGSGGSLDRLDNTKGHFVENVVPCCPNCNLSLSDMPQELKQLLTPALTIARQRGLFDIWQHPRLRKTSARQEK